MSGTWDSHLSMVNGLIAQQRAQRTARGEAAATSRQAAPVPPVPGPAPDMFGGDPWQGGANGGMAPSGPPGEFSGFGGSGKGFGGFSGLGGFGPTAMGLIGGLLGTAIGGPFGGTLGAWGGRSLGGLLGTPSGPQATAQDTVGPYGGVGIEVAPAGYGGGSPGEIGSPGFGGGTATDGSTGSTGFGGSAGGSIGGGTSENENEGWQQGGYTGAGRDGVVQPSRRAGVVHEGEYVIPAHMVRRMGLLDQGSRAGPFPQMTRR